LGGVVILLTWLWLTSFTALFGAVINAEVERQTTKDTTEPGGKPMGSRGAFAADTLGGKAR
jgi:membrane protein